MKKILRVKARFAGREANSQSLRSLNNNRGQSATEYMLLIAVVVLGLVAAASRLIPMFETGVKGLGENITATLKTNQEMTKADK